MTLRTAGLSTHTPTQIKQTRYPLKHVSMLDSEWEAGFQCLAWALELLGSRTSKNWAGLKIWSQRGLQGTEPQPWIRHMGAKNQVGLGRWSRGWVVVTAQSRVFLVSRRGAEKAKTTHYYAGKRKTQCPNLMVLVPGAECQPCIGACRMQDALQCMVENAHTTTHA